MRNFPGGFDLSGMDPPPTSYEIGAVLDAAAEYDAEAGMDGGAYDADQTAADCAASLTDSEFAELEASYLADTALPGPELAGVDVGGVIDLAADMNDIDRMLATMTDREHQRQVQDAAESGRRRASTEVRLSNAMRRVDAGTYTYGQQPAGADLAADPGIDALFATGPVAGPRDLVAELTYQLSGGVPPARSRRQPGLPPVGDLSRQIGLR